MTGPSPIDVVNRLYAAEHAYMNTDGPLGSADFADMAASSMPTPLPSATTRAKFLRDES